MAYEDPKKKKPIDPFAGSSVDYQAIARRATKDPFAGSSVDYAREARRAPAAQPVAQVPTRRVVPPAGSPVQPAYATRVGASARDAALGFSDVNMKAGNLALGLGTQVVNNGSLPVRTIAGGARDAYNGFVGNPASPNAGQPTAGFDSPRIPVNPVRMLLDPQRQPTAPTNAAIGQGAARRVPAAAAAPAAAAVAPTAGSPDEVIGTFNGRPITRAESDKLAGGTNTVPAAPAAAGPSTTGGSYRDFTALRRQPQDIARETVGDQRGVALQTRSDAAQVLNPMSADAEILRRIENSNGSYFNRGSPSSRRAIADALTNQLEARNGASAAYQNGANGALVAGANGAITSELNDQNSRAGLVRDELQQRGQERVARIQQEGTPQVITDADGNLRRVVGSRADNVLGADGKPVKAATSAKTGGITPQDVFKAYTDQATEISKNAATPEDREQQLAALRADPIYSGLFGGQGDGATPAPPQVGTVKNGYKFMGGNPADAKNWEKAQ